MLGIKQRAALAVSLVRLNLVVVVLDWQEQKEYKNMAGDDDSKRTRRPKKKNALTQQDRNKKRMRATPRQLETLKRAFEVNMLPNRLQREEIGREIDMTERSVQIWFQNKRAKNKKQLRDQSDHPSSGSDGRHCMSSVQDYRVLTDLGGQHSLYIGDGSRSRWLNEQQGPFEVPLGASPYFTASLTAAGQPAGLYMSVRLRCSTLSIGRWTRLNSPPGSVLSVQYVPASATLSYYVVTSDPSEYRLDVPIKCVQEIVLRPADAAHRTGQVSVELVSALGLRYFRRDGAMWVEQADFTEYEQASHQHRHVIKGSYHELEQDMNRLYSFLPHKAKVPPSLLTPPNSANTRFMDAGSRGGALDACALSEASIEQLIAAGAGEDGLLSPTSSTYDIDTASMPPSTEADLQAHWLGRSDDSAVSISKGNIPSGSETVEAIRPAEPVEPAESRVFIKPDPDQRPTPHELWDRSLALPTGALYQEPQDVRYNRRQAYPASLDNFERQLATQLQAHLDPGAEPDSIKSQSDQQLHTGNLNPPSATPPPLTCPPDITTHLDEPPISLVCRSAPPTSMNVPHAVSPAPADIDIPQGTTETTPTGPFDNQDVSLDTSYVLGSDNLADDEDPFLGLLDDFTLDKGS